MRLRPLPASVACTLFLVGCGEAAESPTSVRVPEQQLAVLSSPRCELGKL